MSNSRNIRRPGARPMGSSDKRETSAGGKKWWILGIMLLLVLMAGGAWAFYPSTNPAITRIEELRAEMEANPDKRRELWPQMREQFEKLSDAEREALFEPRRREWEARQQKQLNEFFAMTPQQQIAHLDKEIDEDIEEDKERERRRAERASRGESGDRGPRGRGDWGGGGGGGGRGPRDNNGDPNARGKRYLDSTTPQSRAQRSEYRRREEERRIARGLPPRGGRR